MVEIGPGLGALTRPLLERVKRLTVIEIDRDLAARIRAEFSSDRLILHNVDALSFDFATLGGDLRIIGNLPYNISSPLLFHLSRCEDNLRDLTVMLQREVVQRMVAAPATPAVITDHRVASETASPYFFLSLRKTKKPKV